MPDSGYDWGVLAYVLLAVAALIVIGLLARGAGRSNRGDETHRFDRARELTREWSRNGQEKRPAGEDGDGGPPSR